ncbi:MAG TPA: ERCC4 domain-containing protein [Geobacterales bacterium]|nr:ERCC4 domain-containing protein [Geobacterales bacterium]
MEKPIVIVDERERASEIPELLVKKGVSVRFRQLPVGDYLISEKIAIERKSLKDFAKSIYDGRLFDQASRLKDAYETPVIIVEGEYSELPLITDNINALRGAILSLIVDFDVKILHSSGKEETAEYISLMAKQQNKKQRYNQYPVVKGKPHKIEKTRDWQLYILQSLPGIGVKNAEKLLNEFKSLKQIFNASEKDLARILGEAKARKIIEIINKRYDEISDLSAFAGEEKI